TTAVTITAEDAFNSPVTGFNDPVTLVDSFGGETFTPGTFVNGVATFTSTLDTAATQLITAIDQLHVGVQGTSNAVTVTPAAIAQFVLSASPTAITAGGSTTLKVTAEDQFGNINTSFAGP